MEYVPSECHVCGDGTLGPPELDIPNPDRFEFAAGVSPTHFRRYWARCISCGAASNVHLPRNAAAVANLASAYYEVDFPGRTLGARFAEIMGLPPERSDNAARVQRVLSFARGWLSRGPAVATRRIVDIGAGLGVFLTAFLSRASADGDTPWIGVGIEPDPDAAAHLRSLDSFEVLESHFQAGMGLPTFDVATLNKVLEHIALPRQLLHDLRELVNPDGLIYVEVPDVLTLYHRPPSDNILGSVHHHLYDPASLSRLIDSTGWSVLHVGRVFEPSGKITVYAFATTTEAIQRRARGAGAV